MNFISNSKVGSGRAKGVLLLSAIFFCSVSLAWSQTQLPEGSGKRAKSDPLPSHLRGGLILLPNGRGKQIVQTSCVSCHELGRLAEVNFGHIDWKDAVDQMVAFGAPVAPDNVSVVVDYLAKNFPGTGPPTGAAINGPIKARINEVKVPNDIKPEESLFAVDGSLWFTTTSRPSLMRYNPKTKQFKEYPFKNPKSGAHSIFADKDGDIWFTARYGGYVGKVNAKTGEITEYPIPGNPLLHDITIDQKGTVWFDSDDGNLVGKIIPATGEVKLAAAPTPNSNPYEITVNSKGVPFFTEFYKNQLASVDPDTMAIREYVLPNPGTRPKRLVFTPDDVIWYDDYGRGYLGRYDPKTGAFKEWPSPGGRRGQPYGLTLAGGIIWYVEGNTKPVTVVRFDTKTEKFQTWLLPTPGERVHDIVHSPEGDVWFGRGSVDGGVLDQVEIMKESRK